MTIDFQQTQDPPRPDRPLSLTQEKEIAQLRVENKMLKEQLQFSKQQVQQSKKTYDELVVALNAREILPDRKKQRSLADLNSRLAKENANLEEKLTELEI